MAKRRNKAYGDPKEDVSKLHKVQVTLAEGFDRVFAYIIDVIVIVLPIGIILASLNPDLMTTPDFRPVILIYFLGFLMYFFLLTWLNRGQTLGEMIFRLRVLPASILSDHVEKSNPTGEDEISPSLKFLPALLHCLGKVPYVLLFDMIIGYFVGRKYHFPQQPARSFQIWADTIVTKEAKEEKPEPFEYTRRIH